MSERVYRLARLPHPDIRVVTLTPELAARLHAEADRALNGDTSGACSLQNMRTSCFASETCNTGSGRVHLDVLAREPLALVAVDGDHFVGCVTAGSTMPDPHFPSHMPPSAYLLSNLCVAHAYRARKISRRLVDAVRARGHPVYLKVARAAPDASDAVKEAFAPRVEFLLGYYAHLGFRECASCDWAYLLEDASSA